MGDNLDLHYMKFIKYAKFASGHFGAITRMTSRMQFIKSLPSETMQEVSVHDHMFDDALL